MTTIAYKDGHVSYDSQATRGDTRTNIEHNKKYTCEGYTFFFSGTVRTIPEFIEKFFEGTEAKKIDNTCAFVVSPEGNVFLLDSTQMVLFGMIQFHIMNIMQSVLDQSSPSAQWMPDAALKMQLKSHVDVMYTAVDAFGRLKSNNVS